MGTCLQNTAMRADRASQASSMRRRTWSWCRFRGTRAMVSSADTATPVMPRLDIARWLSGEPLSSADSARAHSIIESVYT